MSLRNRTGSEKRRNAIRRGAAKGEPRQGRGAKSAKAQRPGRANDAPGRPRPGGGRAPQKPARR